LTLWLTPPDPSSLDSLVVELSKKHSTPSFSAHVTLLGDQSFRNKLSVEEVTEKVRQGIGLWRSTTGGNLEISFNDVRAGPSFFQCILLAVIEDPCLLALNKLMFEALADSDGSLPTYFPHLSLVYGDLSKDEKAAMIESIKSDGYVQSVNGDRGGVSASGVASFQPKEVQIVQIDGEVSDWKVVAKVPLH